VWLNLFTGVIDTSIHFDCLLNQSKSSLQQNSIEPLVLSILHSKEQRCKETIEQYIPKKKLQLNDPLLTVPKNFDE